MINENIIVLITKSPNKDLKENSYQQNNSCVDS